MKTLAIVYKLEIEFKNKKYVFIGHTLNLEETQKDIILKLKNNKHENIRLQELYNLVVIEADPQQLGLYIKFKTLQALRQCYYPNNVIGCLMKQLTESFINTIREDYRNKNKEYLVLN